MDGDGVDDEILVDWRIFLWKWRLSSEAFSDIHTVQWGLPGKDVPMISRDRNIDGRDEIAVFRGSSGQFAILHDEIGWPNGNYEFVTWGLPGDIPFSGDTNQDGQSELIVWRPSNGTWYVLETGQWPNGDFRETQFGLPGDVPWLADTNNDGRLDFGVFRPSTGHVFVHEN